MTILPHLPLPCDLSPGTWLLGLLFIYIIWLSWTANLQCYPLGGAQAAPAGRAARLWRMRARTPEACEACQNGLGFRIFRPRTDVVPYGETKSACGRRKTLNTAGHACPNPTCAYFAVTDAQLHAVVGNAVNARISNPGNARRVARSSPAVCTRRYTG